MQHISSNEKRREPRTHLYYYIKVFDPKTNALLGHLVDISPRGALMSCNRQLDQYQFVRLSLEDSLNLDSHRNIQITAQCRWSRRDDRGALFDAGLMFIELPNRAREMLRVLH